MLIRQLGEEHLVPAYNILFQQIYPNAGEDAADWGVGRSVVEPLGSTEAHSHIEHELFIVVEGRGVITMDDETQKIAPGQAVLVPAGAHHQIVNRSTLDRLVYLNVYWPPEMGSVDL